METLNKIIPQPQLKEKNGLNILYKTQEYATYDFDGEGNTECLRNQGDKIPLVNEAIKNYPSLYYPAAGELGLSFQYIQKLLNGLQKIKDKYNLERVDKPDMTSYIYSSSTFVGVPEKIAITNDKDINSVWALNSYLGSLYQKSLYISDLNGNLQLTKHNSLKFFKYIEDKEVTIDNDETINISEDIQGVSLSRSTTSDFITYTIEENENIENSNSINLTASWSPQTEGIKASLSWYINSSNDLGDSNWELLLESEDIHNLNSTTNIITSSNIYDLIGISIPINIEINKEVISLIPQSVSLDNIESYPGKEFFIKLKINDHNNGTIWDRRQKIAIKVIDKRVFAKSYDEYNQEELIFNLDFNLTMSNNDQLSLNTWEDLETELNNDIPYIRRAITKDIKISNNDAINLFLYSTVSYPTGPNGEQIVYSLNPGDYCSTVGEVTGISCLAIAFPKGTAEYGNTTEEIINNLTEINCSLYIDSIRYHEISISPMSSVYHDATDFILFKIPIDDNIEVYSKWAGTFKGDQKINKLKLSIIDNNYNTIFEKFYELSLHDIKVKLSEGLYLYDYGDDNTIYNDKMISQREGKNFKTWYYNDDTNNYVDGFYDPYLGLSVYSFYLNENYYAKGNDEISIINLTDIFAINRLDNENNGHILFTKPCLKDEFTPIENTYFYVKNYNNSNKYINFLYNYTTSGHKDIKYAYVRTFFNKDAKGLYSGDPYFIELSPVENYIYGLQIGGLKQQIILNNYWKTEEEDSIWNYIHPIFIYNDSSSSVNITIKDYTRTLYDNYGTKTISIEPHELIYLCQNRYLHGNGNISLFIGLEFSINNSAFKCLRSNVSQSKCLEYINKYHQSHYYNSLVISNEILIDSYPAISACGFFTSSNLQNYEGTMFHIQYQNQTTENYSMVLVVLKINKTLVSNILEISSTINYNISNNEINDTSNELWLTELWQPSNLNGLEINNDNYSYWYIPYFYNKVNDNTTLYITLRDLTIQDNDGRWFYYNMSGNEDIETNTTGIFDPYNPDYSSDLISVIDNDGYWKFNKMRNTSNYCMICIKIDYLDIFHSITSSGEYNLVTGITINNQNLQN